MSRPALPRSLALLAQLRRRRRSLRTMGGIARMVAWLTALVWLSFLLDWTLDLPVGIRAFHLLAGAVLLVVGLRVFWFGSRRRLTDEQLAAQVEDAVGSLDQALITAVQLTAADNPRAGLYSPVLLARTVAEAERKVQQVPVERLLRPASLIVAVLLASVLLVPAGALAMLRPDLTETYARRNLLLSDVAWPREYHFELVQPPEDQAETLLAMGEALTVQVRKLAGGDARVFLRVEHGDGEEQFALERRGEDLYRKVFRNVTGDFRFRVEGGDYRGTWHAIAVRLRPRIEEISLRYVYPTYIGQGDGAETGLSLGGHVKVPVGTTVHYEARASLPVRSAARVESTLGGDEVNREELTIVDGHELSGSFLAQTNGHYQFELVSEDGFQNARPIRYRIAVIPDHPPEVHFVRPGKNLEISTRAQLTLELEARDDHGVMGGELLFRRPSGDAMEEIRITLPELAAIASGDRRDARSAASFELDVESLASGEGRFVGAIVEGARIEYLAEVRDAIGQVGSSRTYFLTVVRQEDLVRIIQDDLSGLRESLDETLSMQREARRELERIQDDARISGGRVSQEELPNVRQRRLDQEKIRQRLEENDERLQEIVDRVVQNRLHEVKELPWIQGLREQLSKLSREEVEAAVTGLDHLRDRVSSNEATDREVADAVERMRASERGLQDVVNSLREWGDLRTIVRKLEELLRNEQELEQNVRARVRDTLDPGAGGGSGDGPREER